MKSLNKLKLVLWKNWILRKRHYIITGIEIILPTLLSLLLVVIHSYGGENFSVHHIDNATIYPKEDVISSQFQDKQIVKLTLGLSNSINLEPVYKLYYTPNISAVEKILANLKMAARVVNVDLIGVRSEQEILDANIKASQKNDYFFWGGIVFTNQFPDNHTVPQNLKYQIRFSDLHQYFTTGRLVPNVKIPGPNNYTGDDYTSSRFLVIQHLIALNFMELVAPNREIKPQVTMQRFPYPPYYLDEGFSMILESLLPMFMMLSFLFTVPTMIKSIVYEKEKGVKELMQMMGLPSWIQWFGWFFSNYIIMMISTLIIIALLCIPLGSPTAVLKNSAPELVLFMFFLYVGSAIMFSFFISTFFTKPTLATAAGVLAWILSYSVPYNIMAKDYETLSLSAKLLSALLPNMSMAWTVKIIAGFEGRDLGLQWAYLTSPGYLGDNLTPLHIIGMMILNIFLYGFLTWYMDNVLPGIYGVPKPWYFLFTKNYWIRMNVNFKDDIENNSSLSNEDTFEKNPPTSNIGIAIRSLTKKNYWIKSKPNFVEDIKINHSTAVADAFEKDPSGSNVGIAIRNLTKMYGWFQTGKLAVDDISLNIYENEITALLGHNGAGKTTTMSVLTGMYAPTKGTAYIDNLDITTHIDQARERIGLCPQDNMLFHELTTKEHLEFFGKLKGLHGKQLDSSVTQFLNKIQLWEKRNTFAKNLSGGMKRKLSLGIALIGKSKIVMLDEPTSGLDPEARRAIWDLLQEMRVGRTILLTTHFMEEADVLGDRIAIMAHGKIKCWGTPMFLKNRFGAGYHLNISKDNNCDVPGISQLIKNHVPSAYLNNNINAEVSYILPSNQTTSFPALFTELEKNLSTLGISGFGVSVTTMEEVFLKVGELAEKQGELENPLANQEPHYNSATSIVESKIKRNTGLVLLWQQFLGLLSKRWFYGRRRWLLVVFQILLPVAMTSLALFLNSLLDKLDKPNEPPVMKLDLSPYGSTTVLYSSNNDILADSYVQTLPKDTQVDRETNVELAMLALGEKNLQEYRELCVIGAEFISSNSSKDDININSLYSGLFLHSKPTALAQIHNALLQFYTNSSNWTISVENAPLPNNPVDTNNFNTGIQIIKSLMMGIFIPIGLSFLTSSYVVLPVHERTSKSKHLQLMTGVGGANYWGTAFIWDFIIYFITSCIMLLMFKFLDSSKLFTAGSALGVVYLLLILYGVSSIPFSYMMSFLFKLPASGYAALTVFNMLSGIVFSIMIFSFEQSEDLKSVAETLRWFFYIFPSYTITLGFMNLPFTTIHNQPPQCNFDKSVLDIICVNATPASMFYPCCPACGGNCIDQWDYLKWEYPGIGREVIMLLFDAVFYFALLCLIEAGVLYRIWYPIKKLYVSKKNETSRDNQIAVTDSDVLAEQNRISNLVNAGLLDSDALVIHNLTKKFWSLLAVDHLNVGVKKGECFGLLGINGAGKTTTFRMLTGDEVITSGNAYLHGYSLKHDRIQFLKQISYCPQFDALIDHLTGREMLYLFARLRGIVEEQISDVVTNLICFVGIEEYADKITRQYSGGNKRKLSAAIALIGEPPMIFLDEPTTGVDPVSRRKLWDILTSVKNSGTSLILTSHSMEECEALCSRIAIMVNGQFQCLGPVQHLKNKFGQGFTVMAKLDSKLGDRLETFQTELQEFIEQNFQQCTLKDSHQGMVHYHIADTTTPWTRLFGVMEEAKETFHLEDYSVSQTTLEQVFLSFARFQREDPLQFKKFK